MKVQTLANFKQSGHRLTASRRKILTLLRRAMRPLTAHEIVALLAGDGITRSTVYRMLQLLEQEALVDVSENARHEQLFELLRERHHHHLLCRHCGRTVDIRCHVPAKTLKRWQEHYGFRITNHSGDVFGVCSRCLRKGAGQ